MALSSLLSGPPVKNHALLKPASFTSMKKHIIDHRAVVMTDVRYATAVLKCSQFDMNRLAQ